MATLWRWLAPTIPLIIVLGMFMTADRLWLHWYTPEVGVSAGQLQHGYRLYREPDYEPRQVTRDDCNGWLEGMVTSDDAERSVTAAYLRGLLETYCPSVY